MRSFLLIAAAALSFSATMTFETTEANAVVCARGVIGPAAPEPEAQSSSASLPWSAGPWWWTA
jgi:hypothetical protein